MIIGLVALDKFGVGRDHSEFDIIAKFVFLFMHSEKVGVDI